MGGKEKESKKRAGQGRIKIEYPSLKGINPSLITDTIVRFFLCHTPCTQMTLELADNIMGIKYAHKYICNCYVDILIDARQRFTNEITCSAIYRTEQNSV